MSTEKEKPKDKIVNKKENNNLSCNFPRLSSFTLSRDLTLGGPGGALKTNRGGGTPKKVYTPNLNVTRNKNENFTTSNDYSHSQSNKCKLNIRGKGHGGRNSLIQTSGVFSQGICESSLHKSSSFSSFSRSKGNGSDVLHKQTFSKKDNIKLNFSKIRLNNDILKDSTDDEETEIQSGNIPIKLLHRNESEGEKYFNSFHSNKSPKQIKEFFSDTNSKFFLLQLPNCLPIQSSQINTLEGDGTSTNNIKNENNTSLKDLKEGQIGKLIKYQSGKHKLVLGNTYFDLDLGIQPKCLQEIISIETNPEERSGNLASLGEIQANLTAIPDWNKLL